MPKLRPLGSQVLIMRARQKAETESGLVIPERAQQRSRTAVIMAKGPKCEGLDDVICGAIAVIDGTGKEVKCDGEEYEIVFDKDVIAVLED